MALHSMTGYGKNSFTFQDKKITFELKSLNSKTFDLYTKIPSCYRELELSIRQIINEELERGKIDLTITIENTVKTSATKINKDLALAYYKDIQELNTEIKQSEIDYLALLLKMPEILVATTDELTKEESNFILNCTKESCQILNQFRIREGKALSQEFTLRINQIKSLLEKVQQFEGIRVETIRERMRKALEEIDISQLDSNRFEQELIYYIEKLDISEEKMRLETHLDYFLETMNEEASGKKLGFITQEIGREINTLGSKSYHSELQKIVVEMKDYLEKIKEQVLNTL